MKPTTTNSTNRSIGKRNPIDKALNSSPDISTKPEWHIAMSTVLTQEAIPEEGRKLKKS